MGKPKQFSWASALNAWYHGVTIGQGFEAMAAGRFMRTIRYVAKFGIVLHAVLPRRLERSAEIGPIGLSPGNRYLFFRIENEIKEPKAVHGSVSPVVPP